MVRYNTMRIFRSGKKQFDDLTNCIFCQFGPPKDIKIWIWPHPPDIIDFMIFFHVISPSASNLTFKLIFFGNFGLCFELSSFRTLFNYQNLVKSHRRPFEQSLFLLVYAAGTIVTWLVHPVARRIKISAIMKLKSRKLNKNHILFTHNKSLPKLHVDRYFLLPRCLFLEPKAMLLLAVGNMFLSVLSRCHLLTGG